MLWYSIKLVLTAAIIVVISEVSKKLPILGSLIASLPLISILGMIWMYGEKTDTEKIASHSVGTFWYVIPSLPMFLVMPWLMRKWGISFPLALGIGVILTGVLYLLTTKILTRFGMSL